MKSYISGHLSLTPDEFEKHYRPAIEVALARGDSFVVGNACGTDKMSQDYLFGKTDAVAVHHEPSRYNRTAFHLGSTG